MFAINKLIQPVLILSFLFFSASAIAQTLLGVDVSHHQGNINWSLVKSSGKVYAYVKASEGMTYTDPKFVTNMTNGTAAGVIMGAYHFARPDNNTALQDANNFLNNAGPYIGDGFLPPVLDLEDIAGKPALSTQFTSSQLTAWVQTWMNKVESQTGVKPMIYISSSYANFLQSSLNTYGLWIPKPNTSPSTPPTNLGNWNTWVFKQYSWEGNVPGISGAVDLNVFNGTAEDFNTLIGAHAPNDDCADAISIESHSTCTTTAGSVEDATPSGLPKAACDQYSGTPLLEDVFFKFVATNTHHTILVDPTGDLDAVVALYGGSDCSNLAEIACSDNGGGFGQSETLDAPNLTIGQTYWIRVYDYGSQPPSDDNFNICVTHADAEDIALSDAVITSSTFVNAGETVTAEVIQNYSGSSATLPNIYLYYYLSTDCTLDANDVLLYDQEYSTINSNDASDEESQVLTIPNGTAAGDYYILFVGDATNVIDESDESNNTACANITVTNGATQDIYLSAENITSSSIVTPGATVSVEVSQNYSGDANALPNIYLYYYLSTDCNLDTTDILLDGQDFSTLSSSDLSDEESQDLTIPNNTVSGTYYILFVGDATDVISESDENNNTACAEITVVDSLEEDIYLTDPVITSSTSINEGETITVEVTQNYSGPASTVPTVYLYYYLSTDCTLDNTDVLLNDQQYSTINSNDPSDEESIVLTIPHGTNLGKYYILVVADATNVISETDENNNTSCLQIFIKSAVAVQETTLQNKIKIFPNPATSNLQLDIDPAIKISHIEFINSLGQSIKHISNPKRELDISDLPEGVYFIKLVDSRQQTAIYRIVKR